MKDKTNASTMQKHIVPWLIALHGLNYTKATTAQLVRQMIVALCTEHDYLECSMSAEEAAKQYKIASTFKRKFKSAANATTDIKKREGELVDEFKKKGINLITVNKDQFRDRIVKAVDMTSMGYDKKDWDRIQAIK